MKKWKIRFLFASAVAGAYSFLGGCLARPFCVMERKENGTETVCWAQACVAARGDKLSSYTTYFSEQDKGRCANLRLAAARIDGIALQPYGELSFNGVVGPRTKECGYQTAKVIVEGEFVEGIGGGVCQVSTTLYNAALLAGLQVIEHHAHSLRVGYVSPSRDAMVTAWCDLRLYNPRSETVYLSAVTGKGYLRVSVHGKSDGTEYCIESRTIEELPPPEPKIEIGEWEETVREGVWGLRSEAYLKTYRNGVLLAVKRLRVDEYAPQRGVIRKKS